MELKNMVVRVLAGAVLVTGLAGQQAQLNAQDGHVRTLRFGPGGDMANGVRMRGEEADTPEAKELQARQARLAILRVKKSRMEAEAAEAPEVAKLLAAWNAAEKTYIETLENHPQYKELQAKLEEIEKRSQLARKEMQEAEPQQRKEFGRTWMEIHRERRDVQQSMALLPDEIPEIAKLKALSQQAAIAFHEALEKKLLADPEYVALTKIIERSEEEQRRYYQARSFRHSARRAKRRGTEGEADPAKKKEVF